MELGIPELLIILVIVILIFGVGRIGRIGRELGDGIRAFRTGLQGEIEDSSLSGVQTDGLSASAQAAVELDQSQSASEPDQPAGLA